MNERELYGSMAVQSSGALLTELCAKHFPTFDPERFAVVAIRLFAGKETVLTVYAEDRQSGRSDLSENKFPVKKFKKELAGAGELFEFFTAFNFTVTDKRYNLEEIEVINR